MIRIYERIVFENIVYSIECNGVAFWWASSIEEAILNYKEGTVIISSDISRLSCNLILETNEDIENILDKCPELLI